MDVSGALRNLRKQLEFLRGQVDWVIKQLEASLESIGSERISSLKQTTIQVLKSNQTTRIKPSQKPPC
jgi:hypothetical protein